MNRRFGLAPLIGLALASVLVMSGCEGIHNPFSPAGNGGNVPTLTDAGKKALTVKPSDLLPDSAKCSSDDKFDEAAAITGPFKWSDSASIAFAASDKKDMLAELLKENCTNPVLLDMNVQALSAVTIDGWNVGDHNPWMGEFLQKAEKDGLRTAFLTKKQGQGDTIFVTADMRETAALVNTLILNFNNVGVVEKPSLTNWHRPGGGLVAGELPRTALNSKQESLPVLRVELTEKGQGCVFAAGWNVGDKRFETLACKEEVAPAPAGTTAPTGGDQPTGTSTTPPSGGGGDCVEIQGNGTVDCGGDKVPARDPANQGNVPEQVAGGNPATAPRASAAAAPEPAAPYVAPAPPEPAAAASPTPVPRTATPSPSAPGANTPEPGATGCVLGPDGSCD